MHARTHSCAVPRQQFTTPLAHDSAEAITIVYTHTLGMGVTVVYYFRDPQMVD
ncbi:hypothetical protein SALBM311S_12974 [Streptomyces alboniger]